MKVKELIDELKKISDDCEECFLLLKDAGEYSYVGVSDYWVDGVCFLYDGAVDYNLDQIIESLEVVDENIDVFVTSECKDDCAQLGDFKIYKKKLYRFRCGCFSADQHCGYCEQGSCEEEFYDQETEEPVIDCEEYVVIIEEI